MALPSVSRVCFHRQSTVVLRVTAGSSLTRQCFPTSTAHARYASTATATAAGAKKPAAASAQKKRAAAPPKPKAAARPAEEKRDLNELSEVERIKEVERMMALQHLMPTVDPWGQEFQETLDVMIPHKIQWSSPLTASKQLMANAMNKVKNYITMSALASSDAIPNVRLPPASFGERLRRRRQMLGTQSTEPDALLAPFRELALETYTYLARAMATGNVKDVQKVTTSSYRTHALDVIAKSKSKHVNINAIWQLHRVIEPTQVLSIRFTEGYLDQAPPRMGHRYIIHALCKFHTEQSMELYSSAGIPLHKPLAGATKTHGGRIAAEPKRVLEYFILEKKGWLPGPWQIREQVWPSVENK